MTDKQVQCKLLLKSEWGVKDEGHVALRLLGLKDT